MACSLPHKRAGHYPTLAPQGLPGPVLLPKRSCRLLRRGAGTPRRDTRALRPHPGSSAFWLRARVPGSLGGCLWHTGSSDILALRTIFSERPQPQGEAQVLPLLRCQWPVPSTAGPWQASQRGSQPEQATDICWADPRPPALSSLSKAGSPTTHPTRALGFSAGGAGDRQVPHQSPVQAPAHLSTGPETRALTLDESPPQCGLGLLP